MFPFRRQLCDDRQVTAPAAILHADLDAFYASVEQRDDPALRGRPVIVGAGVVMACSYEAKRCGVRTAMGGRQARALCPDAVVVPPRMHAYTAASKAVFDIFDNTTPLVEGISIDEAFLDVSGLRRISGPPLDIATRLRRAVADEVGLPITVGIARTKFLAKIASAVAKPDGLLEVPAGTEIDFLHPLPVERLWGVGKVTSVKLHARGVRTVADLAAVGEAGLVSMLGPGAGRHLAALAANRDPRSVQTGKRRGSIGSQHAMGRGRWTIPQLDADLTAIVDRVSRRMRKAHRIGRTVVLRMRFDDFGRATRSRTLPMATAQTQVLLDAVRRLLAEATPLIRERGITMIGMSVSGLTADDAVQLALPFDRHDRDALDVAVDGVRVRFGNAALSRARLMGRSADDFSIPMLPD
ncbi:DNA polymerase IV [Nakamurella sp. YIM 132087]|uniref:DNA polymerase IV n=1 Tax=Nakamurella alba TaxID=2665158 RepID=A0A7K1FM64_9ACTN|nr:DNA polymerase IV [Nakamurella alba]